MMNYRSAKKKKEQKKRGVQFGLVILLVILGFSGVYRWASTGFSPISSSFWKFSNGDFSVSFVLKDKKHLERDIVDLKDTIQDLELEILRTEIVRKENEDLKTSLGYLGSEPAILTSIILRPNRTLYNSLVVDAGSRQGVKVGDIMLAHGLVAVGRVVDVRENISHVQIFSQSDASSVLSHAPTNTPVDVVGRGGSAFTFTVQRDIEISEGDILTLPGSRGYIVGLIEKVSFNQTDPFQTVLARSVVNINELRFVEIVNGYAEQF